MYMKNLDEEKFTKKMTPFSFVTSPQIYQRTLKIVGAFQITPVCSAHLV